MSHTLYEDPSSNVAEQIKAWEEIEEQARVRLATLRAIAERFPDVVDLGKYQGNRLASKSAHEVVTHFDPSYYNGRREFATGVLYLEVDGGGRIYSARPVNLADGFARFQSPGYKGSLIDALRSTTRDAEAAQAAHEEQERKRATEREAQDKAAAEAETVRKAQPVKIVGDFNVESLREFLSRGLEV